MLYRFVRTPTQHAAAIVYRLLPCNNNNNALHLWPVHMLDIFGKRVQERLCAILLIRQSATLADNAVYTIRTAVCTEQGTVWAHAYMYMYYVCLHITLTPNDPLLLCSVGRLVGRRFIVWHNPFLGALWRSHCQCVCVCVMLGHGILFAVWCAIVQRMAFDWTVMFANATSN